MPKRFIAIAGLITILFLGPIAAGEHADPNLKKRQVALDTASEVEFLIKAKEMHKLLGTKAAEKPENLKKLRSLMVQIGCEDKPYTSFDFWQPYDELITKLLQTHDRLSAKLLDGILPYPGQYDEHKGSVAQEMLIELIGRIYGRADKSEGQLLAAHLGNVIDLLDGEINFCTTCVATRHGWHKRELSQEEVDHQKEKLKKLEMTKLEVLKSTVEKWEPR